MEDKLKFLQQRRETIIGEAGRIVLKISIKKGSRRPAKGGTVFRSGKLR